MLIDGLFRLANLVRLMNITTYSLQLKHNQDWYLIDFIEGTCRFIH